MAAEEESESELEGEELLELLREEQSEEASDVRREVFLLLDLCRLLCFFSDFERFFRDLSGLLKGLEEASFSNIPFS